MRAAVVVLSGLGLTLAGGTALARVTDPTVVNSYDTRFDVGVASPVGMAGFSLAVPWRYVVAEGGIGWGPTGAQISAMPKVVPLRWGANALSIGLAGTFSYPMLWTKLGAKQSFWQTLEVAWQRTVFIDRLVYLGVGVTRGRMYSETCMSERCREKGEAVIWPELRFGWGMRR